jgi:hypothetical protein
MSVRQLNLRRFVRRTEFVNLRAVITAWLDQHFQLLEHHAPWLHRIGADVYDYCSGTVRERFFHNFMGQHTPRATASCHREVTVVYGFDRADRADALVAAVAAAGWRHYRPSTLVWRPTAALDYPPGLADTPPWGDEPLSPSMDVLLASPGPVAEWRVIPPNRAARTTRQHLPLEVSAADAPTLLSEAFRDHKHALAVTIRLWYYRNRFARARPYRLRRHLRPTMDPSWFH